MSEVSESRAPVRTGAVGAWAPVLAGAALAILTLAWVQANVVFDAENAGVAAYTKSVFGVVDGKPVHCQDRRDSASCLAAYRSAGSPPATLWLGNSQLHSINRHAEGQQPASALLHQRLAGEGDYLVTYSQPNANIAEHRLMFRQMKDDYRFHRLILAVCLDDFRESDIRATISGEEGETPTAAVVEKAFSLQPVVEDRLSSGLAELWPLWRHRQALRSLADYSVHIGRNRALAINAQTKRPVSAALYGQKMTLLRQFVREARAGGVEVVLYVPPYRRDIPGPYDEAQYARFVADLKALGAAEGAKVADLTDIVPGPQWGRLREPLLGTEDYDFMHFTAEGHRRLADSLAAVL